MPGKNRLALIREAKKKGHIKMKKTKFANEQKFTLTYHIKGYEGYLRIIERPNPFI